ncbi:MAG TPA: hypothetical protein VFD92_26945 [Candidatus Binatia bacterium]|nr:hypothetical protein [Candidatus Binatia bacterium]
MPEVSLVIRAKDEGTAVVDKFAAAVDKFASGVERTGQKVQQSSGLFDSFFGKILAINQSLDLAGKAAELAHSSFDAFFAGVERADAINDMSQKLGVSVETLSSFELAAKTAGSSLDGLGQGFKFLSKNLADAAGGNKDLAATFTALGVDARAGLSDTSGVMLKLADAFSHAEDSGAKTALALQLLGRSGNELVPFLNQGREEIARLVDLSDRLGATLSGDTTRAADAFNDNLAIMGTAITGVETQLAAGMLPSLKLLTDELVDVVANAGIGSGSIKELGESIGQFALTLGDKALSAIRDFEERVKQVGFGQAIDESIASASTAIHEAGIAAGRALAEGAMLGFQEAFHIDWGSLAKLGGPAGGPESVLQGAGGAAVFKALGLDEVFARQAQEMAATARAAEDYGGKMSRIVPISRTVGAAAEDAASGFMSMASPIDFLRQKLPGVGDGASKTADLLKSLTEESAKLSATGAIWSQASSGALSYEEAAIRVAAAEKVAGQEGANAAAAQLALNNARQAAINALNENLATEEQHLSDLHAEDAAIRLVVDSGGGATAVQGTLAEATAEAARQAAIHAGANAELAARTYDVTLATQQEAAERQTLNQLAQGNDELAKLTEELGIRQQIRDGIISQVDGERALAVAAAGTDERLRDQAGRIYDTKKAIDDATADTLHLGSAIKDSFDQVWDAIINGTRDLGDALEGIALSIGKKFFDAMLDSKLKSFDPTVKANFLDLGDFGQSVFGNIFSDSGTGSSNGSGINIGGFLQKAVNWAGNLFSSGAASSGSFFSDAGMTGFDPFTGAGFSQDAGVLPGATSGAGGGFSLSLAGAGIGFAGSQFLNRFIFRPGSTGLTGLLARGAEPGINANGEIINTAISTALGAFLGPLGAIAGTLISALGGLVATSGIDRDALRNRHFSGFAGGIQDSERWLFDPAGIGFTPSDIIFALMGVPTIGTALRRSGESIIDSSKIFGGDDGKGGLQGLLGDWTRTNWRTGPATALSRGFTEDQVHQIEGMTQAIFEKLGGPGDKPGDVSSLAEQQGQIMAEFLSRGLEKGMSFDDLFKNLRAFAQEAGVTLTDALKGLPDMMKGITAAAQDLGHKDLFTAQKEGANAFALSLYGITKGFASDFPAGVHLGALALSTLEKDGTKAFGEITRSTDDWLKLLSDAPEEFQKQVADLASQGFEIDTDELNRRLQDVSASAQFIGQNIGDLFTGDDVNAGIDAMAARLREQITSAVQETSLSQLFDTTNIASSFEPVFAVLRELKAGSFNLLDPKGAADFNAFITQAIIEGKANLAEYIPQIKAIQKAWEEVDDTVKKALEPGPLEALKTAFDEFTKKVANDLKSAISGAVHDGIVDGQFDVGAFGQSFETTVRTSVFNGVVDGVIAAVLTTGPLAGIITNIGAQFAAAIAPGSPGGTAITAAEQAQIDFWTRQLGPAMAIVIRTAGPEVKAIFDSIFPGGIPGVDDKGSGSGKAGKDYDPTSFQRGKTPTPDEIRGFADLHHLSERDRWDLLKEIAGGKSLNDIYTELSGLGAFGQSIEAQARTLESFANEAHLNEQQRWQLLDEFVNGSGKGMTPEEFWAKVGELGPLDPAWREAHMSGAEKLDHATLSAADSSDRLASMTDALTESFSRLISVMAGFHLPGAASGGVFSAGGIGVVGEAGPELMIAHAGGGVSIIPISGRAASSLLGGGTPGFALGTIGSGPRVPATPHLPGPGALGRDDQLPDFASAITDAIHKGLEDGASFIDAFAESLKDSVGQKLTDAVIDGFERSGKVVKESEAIDSLIDKAESLAAQGKLDAAAARSISEEIAGHTAVITEQAKQLEPILAEIRKSEAIANSVKQSLDFSSALQGLAANPTDLDAFGTSVEQVVNGAVLNGVISGLLAAGPIHDAIESFGNDLNTRIGDAMKDGVIDASESKALGEFATAGAESLTGTMESLGPVFEALGLKIGDGASKSLTAVKGALTSALTEAVEKHESFDVFARNVKHALFEQVRDGLVKAFIDSAVIGGLLAGPMTAITGIFDRIAKGELSVAEATQLVLTQVGLITGLLNDPTFIQTFNSFTSSIYTIASGFGVAADSIADSAGQISQAADAAEKAECTTCDLEQRLAQIKLGQQALDVFGRGGEGFLNVLVPTLPPQPDTGTTAPSLDEVTARSRYLKGQAGAVGNHLIDEILKDHPGMSRDSLTNLGFTLTRGIVDNSVALARMGREGALDQIYNANIAGRWFAPSVTRDELESWLPGLATGGFVTRPGVFRIAEREPEFVIPLSQAHRGAAGGAAGTLERDVKEMREQLGRMNNLLERFASRPLVVQAQFGRGAFLEIQAEMARYADRGGVRTASTRSVRS